MRFARLSLVVVGIAIAVPHTHAQEFGDQQKGRTLARQICADCHQVGRRNVRSPNSDAPDFAAIASTPGMTAVALNVFFHTSHPTMPNVALTVDQTNDIIAYIMSLKK